MSLKTTMPWLIALLLTSIVAIVLAARSELRSGVLIAAGVFVIGAVIASARTNRPYWRVAADGDASPDRVGTAARRNARLLAMTYAWAALSMQAVYTPPLTGFYWRPGWPLAMILASLGVFASVVGHVAGQAASGRIGRMSLAFIALWFGVQAFLASLVVLALSGLVQQPFARVEWAAAGLLVLSGLAVMMQCVFALRSHAHL